MKINAQIYCPDMRYSEPLSRKLRKAGGGRRPAHGSGVRILPLLLLLLVALFTAAFADGNRSKVNKGIEAFQQSHWDEALNKFQDALLNDPENPLLHFNIGDVYYKKKNYQEALKSFEKVLSTDDVQLQERAYYNLGNVHYQMNKYQDAISAYKKALELDPTDQDAKHNLELVRAKLKEMAQKQPMNQEQQNQQQGQQGQQQQGQGGEDQEEQQQQQQALEKSQEEQKNRQQLARQNKDQKAEQQSPEQKEQQQITKEEPGKKLSKEEAERILQALKSKEKNNQKMRPMPRTRRKTSVEKDW